MSSGHRTAPYECPHGFGRECRNPLCRTMYGSDGHTPASPVSVADLIDALRPGKEWKNNYTGVLTKITGFEGRIERIPSSAGGFKDSPELIVHHTSNVPPGFKKGHGQNLSAFAEHWHPRGAEGE